MGILQTAERSSQLDPSENVIFQRHLAAYREAAKLIRGTVLEIGSGEGYGITELASSTDKFIAMDKYKTDIPESIINQYNVQFIQTEVPPLKGVKTDSIDFVVTFQVIEHIENDEFFLQEIARVLKPGGQLIMTTPNSLMSLTRSPWHVREYTPDQMEDILRTAFSSIELKGVFGNKRVMEYYEKNKKSVRKITRWDIFNMQYWMPRRLLQVPYDILNRFNRHNLEDKNTKLVSNIKHTDYSIKDVAHDCLDHFIVATKM